MSTEPKRIETPGSRGPDVVPAPPPAKPSTRERVVEWLDEIHDRMGARPLHLAVFVSVLAVLAFLQAGTIGRVSAPAVGWAATVEHPSPAATWVEKVFVKPGDHVEAGAPIATLSRDLVEREIAVLEAGIDRLHKEAEMSLTRLAQEYVDKQISFDGQRDDASRARVKAKALEERLRRLAEMTGGMRDRLAERLDERTARIDDLEQTELMHQTYVATAEEAAALAKAEDSIARSIKQRLESRTDLGKLTETTLAYYEAAIRELQEQRNGLAAVLRSTTVLAQATGRVGWVLPSGSSAALGMSVASIVPDAASEIVAYLPASTPPQELQAGSTVNIQASGCPGKGTLLRTGGDVSEAPLHLQTRLLTPVYGLPVYVSIPDDCRIGVGQVLSVQLARVRP